MLTEVDLAAVIAAAPRAQGEGDDRADAGRQPDAPTGSSRPTRTGNIQRFLEKPKPDEITCDTINAGIYVLEPDTFDRIPKDTPWSIERSFFPSLIERGETFVAYVYRGYWIDIGTPEKYIAGAPRHHGRPLPRRAVRRRAALGRGCRPRRASRRASTLEGPCFVDEGVGHQGRRARSAPTASSAGSATSRSTPSSSASIVWANSRDRPGGDRPAIRSSAATATSAGTP